MPLDLFTFYLGRSHSGSHRKPKSPGTRSEPLLVHLPLTSVFISLWINGAFLPLHLSLRLPLETSVAVVSRESLLCNYEHAHRLPPVSRFKQRSTSFIVHCLSPFPLESLQGSLHFSCPPTPQCNCPVLAHHRHYSHRSAMSTFTPTDTVSPEL